MLCYIFVDRIFQHHFEVKDEKVDNIVEKGTEKTDKWGRSLGEYEIHTEFGIDASGNIVFQESTTKAVYDELLLLQEYNINFYPIIYRKNREQPTGGSV